MTVRRWTALVGAALFAMAIALPGIVHAAAAPTKLEMLKPTALPVQKSDPQSVMVLGAALTTADGKPVAGQRIEFLMVTDILGQNQALLGSELADSGGVASSTFIVTRTGTYEFRARFVGNSEFGASESPVLKVDFEALAEAGAHEQVQLGRIGRWVPWAGLGLTLAVWGTLIFVMARVLIVVPRAARRAARSDGA